MKTEELENLLNNADLDTKAKIAEIFKMNGVDVNAEKNKSALLQAELDQLKSKVADNETKYKDYDKDMEELENFRKEKEEKVVYDRFVAVLGNNKPLNDFTLKGLSNLFKDEVAKNDGRTDEDIFKALTDGKTNELFQGATPPPKPTLNMPGASNPPIPSDTDSYLNEKYKDNPFYQPK